MNILSKNDSNPLVSIVIPCYNAAEYVDTCIASVLNQDYENIEVIVVDDGSTDNSLAILKNIELNESNVKVFTQRNSGACAARNYGIKESVGYYIKFLDSDDFLESGALKAQVEVANSVNSRIIPYGYRNVLSDGRTIINKNILSFKSQFSDLINNNIITTLPLHQRDVLLSVGLFDERLKFRQEWDLHLRLANSGFIFEYHDDCIYTQCIHHTNDRISSRKLVANNELENLNLIRSKFTSNNNLITDEAWSCKYWTLGRQFLKINDHLSAQLFFEEAKKISPKYFLKSQPISYKISYFIFGTSFTERLIFLFKKIKGLTGAL